MTFDRLPSHTPGSEAWHHQRRRALGGSEIAAVLGLSPFESAFALWYRKTDHIGPTEDTPAMEWGRRLETAILTRWTDDHQPLAVSTGRTYLRDGWKLASPDAWVTMDDDGQTGIVEVKHPLYDTGWGPSGTDQVPVYYLCQARWYMHVLNVDVCHFAVLIGGCDYREYTVSPDADDLAVMVNAGRAFLDSIESGQRPTIDGSDATYQVIREMHPDIEPERTELPPELAHRLVDAQTLHRKQAEQLQLAKSLVLDRMGRAQHADLDGQRIAYRAARATTTGETGTPYLLIDRNAAAHLVAAPTEGTPA